MRKEMNDWYKVSLYRLIAVCRYTTSKIQDPRFEKPFRSFFAFTFFRGIDHGKDRISVIKIPT